MSNQIVFKSGLTWDTIPTAKARRVVDVDQLREGLARLRLEMLRAAKDEGIDFQDLKVSAALIIDDFEQMLNAE